MADKEIKIKISTEADIKDVEDLKKLLDSVEDTDIKVDTDVNNKSLIDTQKQIKELNGRHLIFDTDINTVPLKEVKRIINDLDGENVLIKIDTDDNKIKSAIMEVQGLDGEVVEINIDCDDSTLKAVQKEINDLQGEHVQINIDVDDSQIRKAQSEVKGLGRDLTNSLGSTESAITGLISTMAGKSIWDVVYGTSVKAETNKVLLKGMSDATVEYQHFYDVIDKTTDKSLISMQSLIPGLNGIQKATGATGATIEAITPQVAAFGQYVLALTGSEAQSASAMYDLSKGIKGAYAALDQYGITEDSLMATGLWSGKEDDVIGYMNAVSAVTGSTEELMNTTVGLEALVGKAFSRGGKRIGKDLLPVIQKALKGFINLDNATGGWLSTYMLLGGGAISGIVSILSVTGQALHGAKMLGETLKWLRTVEIMEGVSGLFAIGWLLLLVAIGVAIGLMFVYLYNNVDWFREGVDNAVASLKNFASYVYNSLLGTLQWLGSEFNKFTNDLGLNTNDWIQAVLGFILFLPQLPLKVGHILIDTIAKALGFGDDFLNTMVNGAKNAVINFAIQIALMPYHLKQEFDKMLKMALDFAMKIADILTFGGASMVTGWKYGSGEHSPGYMYDALYGELTAMVNLPLQLLPNLVKNISNNAVLMADALSQMFLGVSSDEVINRVVDNIIYLMDVVGSFHNYVYSVGGLIPSEVEITGNKVIDTFLRVVSFYGTLPIQLGIIFSNTLASTLGFGDNFVQTLIKTANNAVNGFLSAIKQMASALAGEFNNMLQMAINFAGQLPRIIWNIAINTVKSWVGGTNEHSPGDMYDAFEGELKAMHELPISYAPKIQSNIGRMGKDMVSIFDEVVFNGTENKTPSSSFLNNEILSIVDRDKTKNPSLLRDLILNVGSVDDDDRINEIIYRIKRELNWNNVTAGRAKDI